MEKIDDVEQKLGVKLGGCYKALDEFWNKNKLEDQNNDLGSELEAFCTSNGIDTSDIDFNFNNINTLKTAILNKVPDADRDAKETEINTILENHDLKKVFNKEKNKLEIAISSAKAIMKAYEDEKSKIGEEIDRIDIVIKGIESDIEDIKNSNGGNEPVDGDSDFEKYSELVEQKEEATKNLSNKKKESKRYFDLCKDTKALIEKIVKEFKKQGIDADFKAADPQKIAQERKKDKEEKEGKNDSEQGEPAQNQQQAAGQPYYPQVPFTGFPQQPMQGNGGNPQGGNNGRQQAPTSVPQQAPTDGGNPAPQPSNNLPALSNNDKISYLKGLVSESKKNFKLSGGDYYKFKDDSEITRVTDYIDSFDNISSVIGFRDRNHLSKLIGENVNNSRSDILAANSDEIKEAMKVFLPTLSDSDITALYSSVYGDEVDKVKFLDEKLPSDCTELETLIKNLNAVNKQVLSYITNKDKFDSLSNDAEKNKVKEIQKKIAIINKYLISPINLKNASQQIERTKMATRIFNRNGVDTNISDLSKKAREGLKPAEISASDKFREALESGVDLNDAERSRLIREANDSRAHTPQQSQTRT